MNEGFLIGIDLGGTNVRAAVVSPDGQLRATSRHRVEEDRSPAGVVERAGRSVEEALNQTGIGWEQVRGVGVGVAGQIRGDAGIVAVGPNLGWREVPFGALLSERLGHPVRVVNDVEAITWGEAQWGAARGARNVLVVFAGTGVGGGLIFAGQLYRGASGVAAEIGHVKVTHGGDPCGCGGSGCLEAYVGGGNLKKTLQRLALAEWPALANKVGGDLNALHPGVVDELAQAGDGRARAMWQERAGYLGQVLANAVTLLNPDVLVLGGTVWMGCPLLREWTKRVFREQVLAVSGEVVKLLSAALGDDGGILGAAALAR